MVPAVARGVQIANEDPSMEQTGGPALPGVTAGAGWERDYRCSAATLEGVFSSIIRISVWVSKGLLT
jgi:hypothetical protein